MGWRGYLISIIALIAGPGLIIDNLSTAKERKAIASSGKEAIGMIVGGGSSGRRRSRDYDLIVEFKPEGRGMKEMEFDVESSFFKAHTSDGSITDPRVTVIYDPSDPNNAYLEGTSPSLPLWVGALVGLAGVGGLIYGMKKRRA